MSSLDGTSHQIDAGFCLCRAFIIIFETQRRVAANLSELRDLRQNAETVLIELFLPAALNAFTELKHLGVIQLLLPALEAHISGLFQFFRKVFEHVFLDSSQDERRDHFFQPFHCLFVLMLYDRALDLTPEYIISVQESGHQIIENAPQLAQPVLDRRSGQCISGAAFDHFDSL